MEKGDDCYTRVLAKLVQIVPQVQYKGYDRLEFSYRCGTQHADDATFRQLQTTEWGRWWPKSVVEVTRSVSHPEEAARVHVQWGAQRANVKRLHDDGYVTFPVD